MNKKPTTSLVAKAKALLETALDKLVTLVAVFSVLGVLFLVSAKGPEIHGYLIRSKVGSKTYTVRNTKNGGGGTGFAMKGASGESYIVTNDHVCEISKDKTTMLVIDDEGNALRRNILYRSEYSDLCLLEGIPGVEGLKLGSRPSIGQIVAVVGHPALRPVTLSRGEIIGTQDISIIAALIGEKSVPMTIFGFPIYTKEECSLAKQKIVTVETMFGPLAICVNITKGAYLSNALIQGGSSGSPVVNFWGNVIGVAFAGDDYGWGVFVSYDDLKELLRMY